MSAATPWSMDVTRQPGGHIRVTIMLAVQDGAVREFRQYLDVDLDEAHATELLGGLALALREPSVRRAPALRLVDGS